MLAFSVASASAAPAGPGWRIDSVAAPTNFPEGENNECESLLNFGTPVPYCDHYEVSATNAGSEPTNGSPVNITDTLPAGLTVRTAVLLLVKTGNTVNNATQHGGETIFAPEGTCTTAVLAARCTFPGVLAPGDRLLMEVFVTVNIGASGSLTNSAMVSGGGGASTSTAQPGELQQTNQISGAPVQFGVSNFSFFKDALNGSEETQAGGHPYELTTTIDLNNEPRNGIGQGAGKKEGFPSSEPVKDVVVDLPLGFAGSTLAAGTCTEEQLDSVQGCAPSTVVGHVTTEPLTPLATANSPIYNIAPEYGHPAEFGFIDTLKSPHIAGYVSVVPTPAGYVLRFVAPDISEINLNRIVVTFYGDPAEEQAETRQHETERETGLPAVREVPGVQVPFFTNPTGCSDGPQVAKIWVDSWHNPARFGGPGNLTPTDLEESAWAKAESVSPPVTGCNTLQFTPEIGSQPTTHEADKPTGLEFEQRLPQNEVFGTNATPALKNTTIVFPEGMTVDPSSADGLGVCTNAQIGYEGPTLFDFSQAPPECPESSKIGTLELETPLIAGKLDGEVFLAAQDQNPFGSTFATYIVVNDPVTGVVLKLAGELKSDPGTGRLTAVFNETPQLPFSALKVHFFGGPRAELATPPNCGTYTTNSALEPWSFPDSGLASTPFDNYTISENCPTGFAPAFTGGSTNLQAGAYTTFQASFERQDDEPELGGARISLPPGMLANVSSVTECSEAQIQAEREDVPGGCPDSSRVGTTTAGAGPGPNPLFVGGNVYWTGPYNGHGACTPPEAECAPFGLAVVVSANPGSFHFGNVVVRQRLFINRETAAATDVSDAFPTFIDPRSPNGDVNGIPIKLRRVDVEINRPGFTFNPTNCAKEAFRVGGDISSVHGESKTLATPFQVTNCSHLKFEPKFSVSVSGRNSKAYGASLTAKVTYPNVAAGTQAGIHLVKVELPKQLPSRLTTLQKACTLAQFNLNPANCPAASKIGMAVVRTPILPVALVGPAIFVSHGGEAFPSLTIVLQGDNVTVDIVGTTFINKQSVTSTTFKTLPDTPFSTFELTLPQGEYSALSTNLPEKDHFDLCGQKLVMPNEFIAQNGTTIHQSTPIAVTGCTKTKTLTRAQKLAQALRTCHKDHNKTKRQKCEKQARKQYSQVKTKAKKNKKK
jgi:hypothetical protein